MTNVRAIVFALLVISHRQGHFFRVSLVEIKDRAIIAAKSKSYGNESSQENLTNGTSLRLGILEANESEQGDQYNSTVELFDLSTSWSQQPPPQHPTCPNEDAPVVGFWAVLDDEKSSHWNGFKRIAKSLINTYRRVHLRFILDPSVFQDDNARAAWLGIGVDEYVQAKHRISFADPAWIQSISEPLHPSDKSALDLMKAKDNPMYKMKWNWKVKNPKSGRWFSIRFKGEEWSTREAQERAWKLVQSALNGLTVVIASAIKAFTFTVPVARTAARCGPGDASGGVSVLMHYASTPCDVRIAMKDPSVNKFLRRMVRFLPDRVWPFIFNRFSPPAQYKLKDDEFWFHNSYPSLTPPTTRVQTILFGSEANHYTMRLPGRQDPVPNEEALKPLQRLADLKGAQQSCRKVVYIYLGGSTIWNGQNYPGQFGATVVNLIRVLASKELKDHCFIWGAGKIFDLHKYEVKDQLMSYISSTKKAGETSISSGCSLELVLEEIEKAKDPWIPFETVSNRTTCFPNILIGRVQQREILSSGKIDAFVSHLGANSIAEGAAYGIPLLGLPNSGCQKAMDQNFGMIATVKIDAAIDLQPLLRPQPYWPACDKKEKFLKLFEDPKNMAPTPPQGAFNFALHQLTARYSESVNFIASLLSDDAQLREVNWLRRVTSNIETKLLANDGIEGVKTAEGIAEYVASWIHPQPLRNTEVPHAGDGRLSKTVSSAAVGVLVKALPDA